LFVRIVVIVVLTEQPLVSATKLSSVEKARQRIARSFKRTARSFKITMTSSMKVCWKTQLYEGSLHHRRSEEYWNQTQLGGPPSLFSDLSGIRQWRLREVLPGSYRKSRTVFDFRQESPKRKRKIRQELQHPVPLVCCSGRMPNLTSLS
jgi:hypothetical protein